MTHHTADEFSPESPDPVTPEQLAAEPPLVELRTLRRTAADDDALARRIEGAAVAELARRRAARLAPPRLVVTPIRRRAGGRDEFTPLIARALRPALLAAAAAVLLVVGVARQGAGAADVSGQQLSDGSGVQALSLHDPNAQWPDQASAPSVDALGRAIGLGGAP